MFAPAPARPRLVALHKRGPRARAARATLAAALPLVLVAACAGSDAERCELHSDCPSGFCLADHTCAPPVDGAGDDAGDDGAGDGPAGCVPDHDGTLTRDELVMAAGQRARFRVASDVPVDTAGAVQPGGDRVWSFAAAAPGDADLDVTLVAPAGQWWASTFSAASYAVRLSAGSELLGVMRLDAGGVALLGVVSPEAGPTRTELTYDPPVAILPTPLAPSAQWSATATVSGLAGGVVSYYSERYQSRVDALGQVATPYGTFPVRRVAVDLTRTVGALVTTRRSFAFVAECYGTVATVTGRDYDTAAELTTAAELWRLTP